MYPGQRIADLRNTFDCKPCHGSYLPGHDFSVGAADVDAGVNASPEQTLQDVPAKSLVGPYSVAVGALGFRVATCFGPP